MVEHVWEEDTTLQIGSQNEGKDQAHSFYNSLLRELTQGTHEN
jgi:hypothetical protein